MSHTSLSFRLALFDVIPAARDTSVETHDSLFTNMPARAMLLYVAMISRLAAAQAGRLRDMARRPFYASLIDARRRYRRAIVAPRARVFTSAADARASGAHCTAFSFQPRESAGARVPATPCARVSRLLHCYYRNASRQISFFASPSLSQISAEAGAERLWRHFSTRPS